MARQIVAELPDRLEKRQALDIAHRAADLAEHEVEAVIARADEILDRVRHVRNDLDGGAEIVAAALLAQNILVDTAGRNIVMARGRAPGEALVMAEIEVGFGAIVGHENFAVLIR